MFFAIWLFFYMAISFKSFGESKGIGDLFLTVAGSVASLVDACSRLAVGALMDYFTFKQVFSCILVTQFVLSLTFDYVASQPAVFLVCLCINNMIQGATFTSTCILYGNMFGPEVGSKAYSYFFRSYSISAIILAVTVLLFQSSLGFSNMLFITSGMTFASFVSL